MGPAAWASVGRAMAMALSSSLLSGPNNIVKVVMKEIHKAIINKDIETARSMIRDLAWRHRESFKAFMDKYSDDLPPDAIKEISDFLSQD